jgi:carbohydrate-binding DOMON domain-containing protein
LSQLAGRDERGKGERGSVSYQIKEFSSHIIAVFMEPINTSAQTQLMILPEADKRERANLRKRQSYRIALAGF